MTEQLNTPEDAGGQEYNEEFERLLGQMDSGEAEGSPQDTEQPTGAQGAQGAPDADPDPAPAPGQDEAPGDKSAAEGEEGAKEAAEPAKGDAEAPPLTDPAQLQASPEEIKAQAKAEIEAMERGLGGYKKQYETQFGPLKDAEQLKQEVDLAESEEVVRGELKDVDRVLDSRFANLREELRAQFSAESTNREQAIAATRHEAIVTAEHNDFSLIRDNSQDLALWVESLNKKEGDEMERIFFHGQPEETVEMLTKYKKARGIAHFSELPAKNSHSPGTDAGGGEPSALNGSNKARQLEAAEAVRSRGTSPTLSGDNGAPKDEFGDAFNHYSEGK